MRTLASAAVAASAFSLVTAGSTSAIPAPVPMPQSGTAFGSAASPTSPARAVFSQMTRAQRVGQLFMVGTPATGVTSSALTAIRRYHVGSVILTGPSDRSVTATRRITNTIQAHATQAATLGVRMLVAGDQEGGYVQVFQGRGFSRMPTALTQGTWTATVLHKRAHTWGGQLRAAGINLDLAPVMDTVPASLGRANMPIGYWYREYGHTVSRVASHGRAFVEGMRSAGVWVTLKHFPGLGRVRGNTDTTSRVTDRVTTYNDPYLLPFKAGLRGGATFVMMSSAYYPRTGATELAAFSKRIVRGMLRTECSFRGVVISDAIGAAQLAAWSPGGRALRFITAGGDIVLTTSPSTIPAMTHAVLERLLVNSHFRHTVNAAVMHVLRAKARMGLLP
jgi:beta-N-acetylhexosaminidase